MSLKRSKRLLGANQFFDGRTPGAGPDELKSILERMDEKTDGAESESGSPEAEPTDQATPDASPDPSGEVQFERLEWRSGNEAPPDGDKPKGKATIPFNRIIEGMSAPAGKPAGIRYSLSELDLMEDVIYQVWKESGKKLQKQEVARLALRVLLEEYGVAGKESVLWRYLQARYRPFRLR
jgi:hypothetical protein